MPKIHPTAIVDPKAELAEDVEIGPFAIVGPKVVIGRGTVLGAHCMVEGRTTIGEDNKILQFSSIGCMPQDKKYHGEDTSLEIGNRNTIHEYCTLSIGTDADIGITRVGDDNWIMAYVHIAHDVQLGNRTIIANYSGLAGHVHVGDWTIIGGLTGIHQFVHLGSHAMIGFSSAISQDVPPFMLVSGNPASTFGYNIEGLRRRGFSNDRIANIKAMHRLIYRDGLTLAQARERIAALAATSDEGRADVALMLDFLTQSKRGIVR